MVAEGAPGERRTAFAAEPEAVYRFVARFFVALRRVGLRHVVVSPGSRSTPLALVAHGTVGLRTWVELDERAAAFFALGLAKESGQPALLVCTSGTAAANYLPAIVEAHHARVPLVAATADRPPELRDWGAGQTIEQPGLYGGFVRWGVELPVPAAGAEADRYAGQLAARAVACAAGPPAGPVHLNWPLREPLAPTPGLLERALAEAQRDPPTAPITTTGATRPQDADVESLATLVREHARGVICVGPLDRSAAPRRALARLAALAGWPVLADPAANLRDGAEPADRSRAAREKGPAAILDAGDVLTRAPGFAEAMRPEVVLRLGDTPVSKAQRLWLEASEPEHVLWLDQGGQWGEPSHRATRIVRGEAAPLLDAVCERLEAEGFHGRREARAGGWLDRFVAAGAAGRAALDASCRDPGACGGLAVAAAVARRAPEDARLFASNSMAIRLLDLAFASRPEPLRVHASRGASGIDGVSSTALGVAAAAALASPARPTLLLTGDLAFLHDLSGLLIARREPIPLTIVVLDDGGGGIFSFLPVASRAAPEAYDTLFRTPHGVDLARAADLFGLEAESLDWRDAGRLAAASALARLESALDRAIATPGVSLVHVRLDAERNEAGFRAVVSAARVAVEKALASPVGEADG